MPGKTFGERKIYLSIVQGSFRQKVDKDTPNAVKREYETSDKKTGVKYELQYLEWFGRIRDIRLKDGKYGESMEIEFDDAIVTINVKSRYFDDFMMKLPNIAINQTVALHPYDFEVDGKQKKGISISQKDEKIKSYYWNDVDKIACNGIPVAPKNAKQTYKEDDWVLFFTTQRKFLKNTLPGLVANIDQTISEESLKADDEEHEVDNSPIREDEIIGEPTDSLDGDKDEIRLEDVPF